MVFPEPVCTWGNHISFASILDYLNAECKTGNILNLLKSIQWPKQLKKRFARLIDLFPLCPEETAVWMCIPGKCWLSLLWFIMKDPEFHPLAVEQEVPPFVGGCFDRTKCILFIESLARSILKQPPVVCFPFWCLSLFVSWENCLIMVGGSNQYGNAKGYVLSSLILIILLGCELCLADWMFLAKTLNFEWVSKGKDSWASLTEAAVTECPAVRHLGRLLLRMIVLSASWFFRDIYFLSLLIMFPSAVWILRTFLIILFLVTKDRFTYYLW